MMENIDVGFEMARARQDDALKDAKTRHLLRQMREETRPPRKPRLVRKRVPLLRRVTCAWVPAGC
jgi:hypothetical protein